MNRKDGLVPDSEHIGVGGWEISQRRVELVVVEMPPAQELRKKGYGLQCFNHGFIHQISQHIQPIISTQQFL